MNIIFSELAWEDYQSWRDDRKTRKKIEDLLKDISRNGNVGIGKPEPLSGDLSGFWSRRINDKDRLVYAIGDDGIYVVACRFHYPKQR